MQTIFKESFGEIDNQALGEKKRERDGENWRCGSYAKNQNVSCDQIVNVIFGEQLEEHIETEQNHTPDDREHVGVFLAHCFLRFTPRERERERE